jgi:hypothetical protein
MMGYKNSDELRIALKAAKEERQQYYFNIAQECKALGLSKAEAARRAGALHRTRIHASLINNEQSLIWLLILGSYL